ncbi:hypothetical protein WICPIJ_007213 [Wickerhamomyces pijperi]|uniref:Uncharacterized protein n=1 Tax=Wickerhamomyces pijperi TaxID=599730 RepID=A0A9P8Q1Z3_WICPI|nr:hypothetical protein WICPIJ_007213 [Wickerhamomyces pijperi]
MTNQEDPEIPITTISRIFQTVTFQNEETRITKQTLQLSSKYLELFVKEAILRSDEARLQREIDQKQGTVNKGEIPGLNDQLDEDSNAVGCLTVKDLEEISGLLVMDF